MYSKKTSPPMASVRTKLIYAKFEAAFEFPTSVMELVFLAIREYCEPESNTFEFHKFETKYRLWLNEVLRYSTLDKDQKRLARIALKACFVLLAWHDFETDGAALLYDEKRFLESYPEFERNAELPVLLKFRNIIAVSLTLMEADNNKAKHLIIASRLSEGKHARYVTGSGQTDATSNRVLILNRESGYIPAVRNVVNAGEGQVASGPAEQEMNLYDAYHQDALALVTAADASRAERMDVTFSTLLSSMAPPTP